MPHDRNRRSLDYARDDKVWGLKDVGIPPGISCSIPRLKNRTWARGTLLHPAPDLELVTHVLLRVTFVWPQPVCVPDDLPKVAGENLPDSSVANSEN